MLQLTAKKSCSYGTKNTQGRLYYHARKAILFSPPEKIQEKPQLSLCPYHVINPPNGIPGLASGITNFGQDFCSQKNQVIGPCIMMQYGNILFQFELGISCAVFNSIYLSLTKINKKWEKTIWNWGLVANQFLVKF